MDIDGQCHCGFLTFRAKVNPQNVSICHCNDCQRLTGSSYRVTVLTPRENIEITGGDPALYVKVGDNGGRRRQYFCSRCGSPVFTSGDDEVSIWGIRWGSINQRKALRPTRQVWCRSAASWIHDLAVLPARPSD